MLSLQRLAKEKSDWPFSWRSAWVAPLRLTKVRCGRRIADPSLDCPAKGRSVVSLYKAEVQSAEGDRPFFFSFLGCRSFPTLPDGRVRVFLMLPSFCLCAYSVYCAHIEYSFTNINFQIKSNVKQFRVWRIFEARWKTSAYEVTEVTLTVGPYRALSFCAAKGREHLGAVTKTTLEFFLKHNQWNEHAA